MPSAIKLDRMNNHAECHRYMYKHNVIALAYWDSGRCALPRKAGLSASVDSAEDEGRPIKETGEARANTRAECATIWKT